MISTIECPYCLCTIESDSSCVSCDSCGSIYHKECWFDNGGCCSRECQDVIRTLEVDVQTEQSDLLVLSREAVESAISHKPERKWNPCLRCGSHIPQGEIYCQNCVPEPEGSADAKNLWPILVSLFVISLAIFWFIFFASVSNDQETPASPTQHGELRQ